MRGRGNGRKGGNSRNQSFESNGPDVRVRGNPQQIVEKYLTLARDATSAGDRINAESYYQFAEHYYRVMNAASEQQRQQQQQQQSTEAEGETQHRGEVSENAEVSENDGGQVGRRRRNGRGNGRSNGGAKEAAESDGPGTDEEAASSEATVEEETSENASA
tara:strand:- start:335 stop:817 length:483 start_codon:yes stop_codon:yes gene_type:complete